VLGVGFWPKLLPNPMLETASSTKVWNNKKQTEKSLSTTAAGIQREAFLSSVLFPHQKNHCLKPQNQPESFLIRKYHCLKPKTRTAVSVCVHGNLTNKAGIVYCRRESRLDRDLLPSPIPEPEKQKKTFAIIEAKNTDPQLVSIQNLCCGIVRTM
jgi:hypothetical protein